MALKASAEFPTASAAARSTARASWVATAARTVPALDLMTTIGLLAVTLALPTPAEPPPAGTEETVASLAAAEALEAPAPEVPETKGEFEPPTAPACPAWALTEPSEVTEAPSADAETCDTPPGTRREVATPSAAEPAAAAPAPNDVETEAGSAETATPASPAGA